MATVSTSEGVRDRLEANAPPTEAPGPPPPVAPTPFGDLASRITGAMEGQQAAAGRVREGLARKAEAVEPRVADVEAELARPKPVLPLPPPLPPPPSRKLTEFLAPVDGESPTASITKLMQAVGLFATGIAGAARGDARAGLAAFKGAMEGWQAGDRERADRAFADWQAKTQAAVQAWERERATYQDIMAAANLSLDQRFKLVQLAALREDNKMLADVAEKQDLEGLVKFLQQQQVHADTVDTNRMKIVEMKAEKDRHHELQVAQLQQKAEDALQRSLDRRLAIAERAEAARMHAANSELLRSITLDQPTSGMYWDKGAGEIRQVSRGEIAEDIKKRRTGGESNFNRLPPGGQALLERLAVAPKIFDRLDELIEKINAVAPGQNITRGLFNKIALRAGISPDLQEFRSLNVDSTLELAAALSGGQPRISILQILRGEASPEAFFTYDTAKRALSTMRTTVKNRAQASTGDPDSLEKLASKMDAYVPPPLKVPEKPQTMRIFKSSDPTKKPYEGPVGPVPPGWEKVPGG